MTPKSICDGSQPDPPPERFSCYALKMRMSCLHSILLTLLISSSTSFAGESPEASFASMKRNCLRQGKSKSACSCVIKNIDRNFKNGKFTEQQLGDAVSVFKNTAMNINSDPRVDAMADLIAGLEFHCIENSNYLGD